MALLPHPPCSLGCCLRRGWSCFSSPLRRPSQPCRCWERSQVARTCFQYGQNSSGNLEVPAGRMWRGQRFGHGPFSPGRWTEGAHHIAQTLEGTGVYSGSTGSSSGQGGCGLSCPWPPMEASVGELRPPAPPLPSLQRQREPHGSPQEGLVTATIPPRSPPPP